MNSAKWFKTMNQEKNSRTDNVEPTLILVAAVHLARGYRMEYVNVCDSFVEHNPLFE